jgi:hypothetical protein
MYNDFKGGKRLLIFWPGDLSIPERWEAIFFQSSYFCKKRKRLHNGRCCGQL